jgi:hypothetical protein
MFTRVPFPTPEGPASTRGQILLVPVCRLANDRKMVHKLDTRWNTEISFHDILIRRSLNGVHADVVHITVSAILHVVIIESKFA